MLKRKKNQKCLNNNMYIIIIYNFLKPIKSPISLYIF